nr:hypothetical protein [Methanobrevibacter arboriphilus]
MNKIIIGKISFILLIFFISVSFVHSTDDYNGLETVELDDKSSDDDSLNNYTDLNNSSIPIFIFPPYEVSSFNESSNVILEFTIKKSITQFLSFCGSSRHYLSIDGFLSFKETNAPLPNQTINFAFGDEVRSFITDENGKITWDYFYPDVYGFVNFQMLFNGSTIYNNGSMINLDPVSTHIIYYIAEPYNHRIWPTVPGPIVPIYTIIDFPSSNKSDSLIFYNSNQNITFQNSYKEINGNNKLKHNKYFSNEINNNTNTKINNNISENKSLEKTVNNNLGFLDDYEFFDYFRIYFENLFDFIKDVFNDLINDLIGVFSYVKI